MSASPSISDVPWHINDITATGLVGLQPSLHPGKRGHFEFVFLPDDASTTSHIDRYNQVREFGAYAGAYHSYTTLHQDVYWYETRPSASPLVKLVPDPASTTGRPIWGLIDDMDDETTLSSVRTGLTLDVLMIAPVGTGPDEFETEDELRSSRQATGP